MCVQQRALCVCVTEGPMFVGEGGEVTEGPVCPVCVPCVYVTEGAVCVYGRGRCVCVCDTGPLSVCVTEGLFLCV